MFDSENESKTRERLCKLRQQLRDCNRVLEADKYWQLETEISYLEDQQYIHRCGKATIRQHIEDGWLTD